MGDRYELELNCAYCGLRQEVYYAESSGFTDFDCESCLKLNVIVMGFHAIKAVNAVPNGPQ